MLKILKKPVNFIARSIGRYLFKKICIRYVKTYPIPGHLKTTIKDFDDFWKNHNEDQKKSRTSDLDKIINKSIQGVLWANSGSVFALLITIMSILLALAWTILSIISSYNLTIDSSCFELSPLMVEIVVDLISLGLLFFCSCIALIILTPALLNRIIENLPARKYAELSLGNLNRTETLTFTALQMWLLCDAFVENVKIPESFDFIFSEENKVDKNKLSEHFTKIGHDSEVLCDMISNFKTSHHRNIIKCIELKKEAVSKLNILPREFSHHILKLSIPILDVRINIFNANVQAIKHIHNIIQNPNTASQLIGDNIKEIKRISKGIKRKRDRDLIQIILYDDLHENLIGLSSVTSTSESLKIFTRAISSVASKYELKGEPNLDQVERIFDELKALLHRSKAHYGFDLLITLENFYETHENLKEKNIPQLLKSVMNYKNDKSQSGTINNFRSTLDELKNVRADIMKAYPDAIEKMVSRFKEYLKEVSVNEGGNLYFLVFGYSKMTRNVLRKCSNELKSYKNKGGKETNCEIFVMREKGTHMLDTRMFRFELVDDREECLKESFTASDSSFLNLLNPDDKVVMLAGAEAYDSHNEKLYHTNNYQDRVEKLINDLSVKIKDLELWIVAGEYKIYSKGFPQEKSIFGKEFFSDHYDKLDIYDLKKFTNSKVLKVKCVSNT